MNATFGWGPWALRFYDQLGSLIAILVWLGWVIYTERRYRTAAWLGWRSLLVRVGRTTAAVALAHALLFALTWLARGALPR